MRFYPLVRPFLFLLPPELAHQFALNSLQLFSFFTQGGPWVKSPLEIAGMRFANPVGIAAGLDKNADYIRGLFSLGCGFIEVGAVTPKPQIGNPKPRLFRLPKKEALINRMGFNNKGVDYIQKRLKQSKAKGIVGVNIGKNKATPLELAYQDYEFCIDKLTGYADFVTINISSPNTPGLRDLQQARHLESLLTRLTQKKNRPPLFVKLSPDLLDHELIQTADILLGCNVDGVIATNTTLSRDGISRFPLSHQAGGMSGDPLFERSYQVVSALAAHLQGRIPLVAVGGINSAERARAMFNAGADLIQLYSGLIYKGPGLIKNILQSI